MGSMVDPNVPLDIPDGIPADPPEEQTKASIAKLTSYSWNIFRYIGDYLHLFGVFVLLATLAKNKSCHGVSRSTQILYFFVFITRYGLARPQPDKLPRFLQDHVPHYLFDRAYHLLEDGQDV